MPTYGWGFGALTNNRTNDFLALLYGHAANYQSRGTFHATEQLSFLGEGLYRDFLHWPNDTDPLNPGIKKNVARKLGRVGAYYAPEQDISFCIVTEVLVARLTRIQLIMEDFYRDGGGRFGGGIHLARGAPRRWFYSPGTTWSVKAAPTRLGRISYNVTIAPQGESASFDISTPSALPFT